MNELFLPTFVSVIGYLILITASIGIITNLLRIIILTRIKNKELSDLLTLSLFGFETLFVVFQILRILETNFIQIQPQYIHTYCVFVNSGLQFCFIITLFTAVAVVRSSYIESQWFLTDVNATQFCLEGHSWTSNSECRKSLLKNMIPIIAISLILAISANRNLYTFSPKFEYYCYGENTCRNFASTSKLYTFNIQPTRSVFILNFQGS